MKTLAGSLIALGLLSTSASAWYCPPGYNQGGNHSQYQSHRQHRPSHGQMPGRFVERPASEAQPSAPAQPDRAPPQPEPEPVPQK